MLTATESPQVAAEASPAQAFFAQAEQAFSERKFAEALSLYLSSYQLNGFPELLFNIGQCYRNLEKMSDAIFYFQRYLALKPDAENRDAVQRLIAELKLAQPATTPALAPFYKSGTFWASTIVGLGAIVAVTLVATRKPVLA
jgi:tetratricopeptide (TPR) repeat protein